MRAQAKQNFIHRFGKFHKHEAGFRVISIPMSGPAFLSLRPQTMTHRFRYPRSASTLLGLSKTNLKVTRCCNLRGYPRVSVCGDPLLRPRLVSVSQTILHSGMSSRSATTIPQTKEPTYYERGVPTFPQISQLKVPKLLSPPQWSD